MMKINLVIVLFVFIISSSCSQKKQNIIIPLENMDFSGIVATSNNEDKKGFIRYLLVDNPSSDQKELVSILKKYADSIVDENRIGKNFDECNINFYKKTSKTSEFIGTEKDFYQAQHDLGDYDQDYIGSYEMIQCNRDNIEKKWILRIQNPYQEIVIYDYCKP